MTPTPKLRFVERENVYKTGRRTVDDREIIGRQKHTILQQWYAYDIDYPTEKGEWRDVPLEKE